MGKNKIFVLFLFIFFTRNILCAENLVRKNYESKRYKVQKTAMYNEIRFSKKLNLIEIAVYDKITKNFWYEWFIINGDREYLLSEFDTNPDLNIRTSLNDKIQEVDIDQFASEKTREIADVGLGLHKEYYTEVEHTDGTFSYFAYSRTCKDTIKMRSEVWK